MSPVKLHNAIVAVCPINGISIGNASDKTTWTFKALETATTEQITAAQSVIDNADLSILDDPATCSAYEFLQRFTQAERIAIEASDDVYVRDFSSLLKAAQEIDFDDSNTLAGMAYLVTLGLLTEERKNEILTH